ncbi:energy transducer TonB [Aquabacterium sp. NJ1]|uniref:energy transducer TonB family protein n=1 Tax=Aquabacterium sp. NJ1 TaxID=1538295 RepID=UPI00068A6D84|nr:energy transducer TonB [Aquabacterium sp. NJ1]
MLQRLRTLWKSLSLLQICLGVSALLHIGLFSFRLVDPEGFNRTFKDTPLEVILVNAGSEAAPDKAQALAQQNLAGGGESTGRATSPLPPSPEAETGDAMEQTARMIEQMQQEQQQLLTQVKNELSALPPPQPRAKAETEQNRADEERRRQLTKLLAEIEKRIREENERPKKRYISPATLKSADALYYSQFRTLVERAGTEHFPTQGGQKLYGELVMEVWLDRQGKVVDAIITQPSRNKQLDKRARAIVMNAGPFGAVPPEVIAGKDLLLISSRFRFTREAGMQATTQAPAPEQATIPAAP